MANHADVSASPLTPSPDVATLQTSPFPSGAVGDSVAVVEFQRIPLDRITPSKTNTRAEYAGPEFEELVADIKVRGVLMPVLVRPLRQITFELTDGSAIDVPPAPFRAGMVTESMRNCGITQDDVVETSIDDSSFELIAGERRYRASLAAGLTEIPARIIGMSDAQAVEAQLVENLQRKNLKPLEEAHGYIELLEVMAKEQPEAKREDLIKQLAKRVNKAPRTVYGMMQLTRLSAVAQEAIEDEHISPSHGDLLVRQSEHVQEEVIEWLASQGFDVSFRALRKHIEDVYGEVSEDRVDEDSIDDTGKSGPCPAKAQVVDRDELHKQPGKNPAGEYAIQGNSLVPHDDSAEREHSAGCREQLVPSHEEMEKERARRDEESRRVFLALTDAVATRDQHDLLAEALIDNISENDCIAIAQLLGWEKLSFESYPSDGDLNSSLLSLYYKHWTTGRQKFVVACAAAAITHTAQQVEDKLMRGYGLDPDKVRAGKTTFPAKSPKSSRKKVQTPAKKASSAKAQPVAKPKALSSAQLASIKPEPRAKSAKKSYAKKPLVKKSAKKGGRK